MRQKICDSWVVYQMTVHGKLTGTGAVCEQEEWDQMESVNPGFHRLVQSGISSEGEAEQLARTLGALTLNKKG